MHELQILGREGHRSKTWDVDVKEQVDEAQEEFARCLLNSYAAFEMGEGQKGSIIRDFNPDAERILLVPPMKGG
jgi:hypothetical protein